MTTSPRTTPKAGSLTTGQPASKPRGLNRPDRAFLQQIAQEIREAQSSVWKRHWKARYGLPPHPQFVRWVKHQANTLSPAGLLRRLEQEHRLEVQAQAALRPDFRHVHPDRYRVLLREVREGLRDTLVPPASTPRQGNPRKKPGNFVPS